MEHDHRTPVTILTGFLGAGKTTLLNRIIKDHPDKRFAIIENEFGQTNIDSDLIIGAEEGIFELTNGCLCCTLSGALADTLAQLIQRKDQYDHLIIETTGIANPQGIAAPFVATPVIQQHFRLDGTIGVVDTLHLKETLQLQQEATWQISAADILLFNKTDLVDSLTLKEAKKITNLINPFATQLECSKANLATSVLLNLQASSPRIIEEKTTRIDSDHDHNHHHISSQTYTYQQAFDYIKLRHFLQVLLMFQGGRIYRMKGILNIEGNPAKMVFQSVQQQTVFSSSSPWKEGETRESKLVVIGRDLKRAQFDKRLKDCLA